MTDVLYFTPLSPLLANRAAIKMMIRPAKLSAGVCEQQMTHS